MSQAEFWFVVGSQELYGAEALKHVAENSRTMAEHISQHVPYPLVFKTVVTSSEDALSLVREANYRTECAGIVTWCHTFSPSRMWAQALQLLQKPWCHFATQFHREIPNETIDMDFMNLNQAAHGDREHAFIGMRLGRSRKVIVGHWQDEAPCRELGDWMRAAVAADFSKKLRVLRFGDNMRDVAVTDGDKVEALLQLGWQVDAWPTADLAALADAASETDVASQMDLYRTRYDLSEADLPAIQVQARIELAMRAMLQRENAHAIVTNFQDLTGLKQLPGLAVQNLMADGYGFGAEGDWKTSALTAVIKAMGVGLPGGCSFVEDYSYNMVGQNSTELASHMLELCPSISSARAKIEVHPLDIGNREDPARLVFAADPGPGVVTSILDAGGRLRLLVLNVDCLQPPAMPQLPVARILWKPQPDLYTALKCWLLAGGGHHSVLSTQLSTQSVMDWAEIMGLEVLHIGQDTTLENFAEKLQLSTLSWSVRKLSCLKN